MSDADELRRAMREAVWNEHGRYNEYKIIAAIDAAGWQVVPKEPTEAMWTEGRQAILAFETGPVSYKSECNPEWMRDGEQHDRSKGMAAIWVYRAMLAAAPKVKGDE